MSFENAFHVAKEVFCIVSKRSGVSNLLSDGLGVGRVRGLIPLIVCTEWEGTKNFSDVNLFARPWFDGTT